MRYLVSDLSGNHRGSFDSLSELIEELAEGALDDPATLRSLYVYTYDDAGCQVGPAERGDEVLDAAALTHSRATTAWQPKEVVEAEASDEDAEESASEALFQLIA